ncbi:myelin protein zero-like protein 2 [Perognathus longimembris pacificus]|uniref:myelin protein zero-like protein 2 n=1 Tax=Perognathus longimembris pacificus TaxID=214514 RepID=UPI00201913A1|nr:myelin protein zero-like protein 2 [Perognathus longimembris pacificus]XP_048199882.1 myelin protein zero-like protein 2 [Perognathus longimembris pacificus]
MCGPGPPRAALLLLGWRLSALWAAAAVEIYTSGALEAVNGTDLRLKCTFSSFAPVGDALTVTWNFRPRDGGPEQFVFYYHVDPFKPMSGRFKDRVVWDGNLDRYDVSIILWKLQFDDNGTYTCQVKNPPDVDGLVGTIRLSVVQTVTFSEIYFLALAIGCACALMIIIVISVVLFQHFRKKRRAERAHKVMEIKSKEEEKLNQEHKVSVFLEDTD